MRKYRVYYKRPEWFRDGITGCEPDQNLDRTHIFLREVKAEGLDEVFHQSQGEVWSPHGEARQLIRQKGLLHTSMCIGDVVEDEEAGKLYLVAPLGFKELPR